jgi:purine-cytosine permease-like protein
MRFRLLARRITLAPTLALALMLTVAACSSSSSSGTSASASSSSAPAASSPAASSAAPSSGSSSAAVAQITANWEKFFASSTPASEKATLLQNGSTFEPVINALVSFPLASGLGAKVTSVTLNSATKATVKYNLTANGQALFTQDQTGTAVLQGGTWKVGDASLCGLFKLIPGGSVPSACNSVG